MLGSACCLSCQDVNALVRSVAVDAIVEVARDAEVMELAESMSPGRKAFFLTWKAQGRNRLS